MTIFDIEKNKEFETFFKFLIDENKKYNLTAITNKNEVYEKHFFDSIQAEFLLNSNAKVVDIGAGAGFPSIPLAILKKDVNFTLIDSVNKKINFLNSAKELLKLNNITSLHSRIEDFAEKNREKFDFCLARGVASLPTLLEYCAPLIKVGGKIIAYKGTNYNEELENAKNAISVLNLKLEDVIKYHLDFCDQDRFLLIFSKNQPTNTKFPRKLNKPRTNPL